MKMRIPCLLAFLALCLSACSMWAQLSEQSLSPSLSDSLGAPIYTEGADSGLLGQLPGGSSLTLPAIRADILDPLFSSIYTGTMTPFFDPSAPSTVAAGPLMQPDADPVLLKTGNATRGAAQGSLRGESSHFNASSAGTGRSDSGLGTGALAGGLSSSFAGASRAAFVAGGSLAAARPPLAMMPGADPTAMYPTAMYPNGMGPSGAASVSSVGGSSYGFSNASTGGAPNGLLPAPFTAASSASEFAGSPGDPLTAPATVFPADIVQAPAASPAAAVYTPAFGDLVTSAPLQPGAPIGAAVVSGGTSSFPDATRGSNGIDTLRPPLAYLGNRSLESRSGAAALDAGQASHLQPSLHARSASSLGVGGNRVGEQASANRMPSLFELRRFYRQQVLQQGVTSAGPVPSAAELRRLYRESMHKRGHARGGSGD